MHAKKELPIPLKEDLGRGIGKIFLCFIKICVLPKLTWARLCRRMGVYMVDNKTGTSPFVGDAPYLCLMWRNFWGGRGGKNIGYSVRIAKKKDALHVAAHQREAGQNSMAKKVLAVLWTLLAESFIDSVRSSIVGHFIFSENIPAIYTQEPPEANFICNWFLSFKIRILDLFEAQLALCNV